MGLILDTSFLVFAEREARRGVPGRADAFLAQRPSDTFFITFTVAGELACGQSANVRGDWRSLDFAPTANGPVVFRTGVIRWLVTVR